jgi:hypothetical protein
MTFACQLPFIITEAISMMNVKVKKRKFEQKMLGRKVVCYVYDVHETLIENGKTVVNLYRVCNVVEVMNFDSVE